MINIVKLELSGIVLYNLIPETKSRRNPSNDITQNEISFEGYQTGILEVGDQE